MHWGACSRRCPSSGADAGSSAEKVLLRAVGQRRRLLLLLRAARQRLVLREARERMRVLVVPCLRRPHRDVAASRRCAAPRRCPFWQTRVDVEAWGHDEATRSYSTAAVLVTARAVVAATRCLCCCRIGCSLRSSASPLREEPQDAAKYNRDKDDSRDCDAANHGSRVCARRARGGWAAGGRGLRQ